MRVLLTGATGFIGSHVARVLVRAGHETYAVIRPTSHRWRIQDIVERLIVVPGDLSSLDAIDERLAEIRPELCLHLAWYVEPGKYLNSVENVTSLRASLDLAARLARLGCRRFVATGTCFEYDTSVGTLSETSPTRPDTLYAATKLALELVVEPLVRPAGMSVAWPRLFYQYGPFEDERRLVPSVILALLRGEKARLSPGEQIRDFLHVEDVAEAIVAVALSELSGPVNIGSGQPVTVAALARRLGTILGREDLVELGAWPSAPADPMVIRADIRRLKGSIAWAPLYGLDDGLRQTVEWWRDHVVRAEVGLAAPGRERS